MQDFQLRVQGLARFSGQGFRFRVQGLGRSGNIVSCNRVGRGRTALETTQGQMDGFLSQLPYKRHLEEVASVGD